MGARGSCWSTIRRPSSREAKGGCGSSATLLARLPGFSLHAATVCEAAQRDKLEKLCRHIARPAIASERLSTNERGQVIYRFKQPFRDGSAHVVLHPLDFIARPAALVPRPRLNLARFHGVFAPNCKHRESVVPKREPRHEKPDKPLAPMTWMRRLKRVFATDIETCPKCGGTLRVIARIENPDVIATILEHIRVREAATTANPRAPPLNTELPAARYQDGSRGNDRLTPRCDRYTSNRRFARPFRLQRPPPHPQRAQRTPLKTSPRAPRQSTVLRNHPVSSGYSSYPRIACRAEPTASSPRRDR